MLHRRRGELRLLVEVREGSRGIYLVEPLSQTMVVLQSVLATGRYLNGWWYTVEYHNPRRSEEKIPKRITRKKTTV
ncbi:hypothetical protein RRG08_032112 [Elysia crispata]|uniref:Uncharacterized protein n=1 Tax=Elysia crispata TaxID=231223 RepID=A0AAE0ZDN0_9GAST|nr:hypothetical protein RRG08_032112 [Elysia crispata]